MCEIPRKVAASRGPQGQPLRSHKP